MILQNALYYPYIDIKNDAWLKNAVLYWDSISTIVPASIREPYKSDIAREFQDAGCLKPIHVNSEMREIDDLTENVIDYLDSSEGRNILHKGTSSIHRDKLPYNIQRLAEINPEKLPYEIRHIFRNMIDRDGLISVDSGFAGFYMTLLATKLSEINRTGLLTDASDFDSLSRIVRLDNQLPSIRSFVDEHDFYGRMHHRRERQYREFSQGIMFNVMIENISIDPEASVKKIIQFKREHTDELIAFKIELEKLTENSDNCENLNELVDRCKNTIEFGLLPRINNLKKCLDDCKIIWKTNLVEKLVTTSLLPAIPPLLLNIPIGIPLFFWASILLTASIIRYDSNKEQILRNNPYSYVLMAKRDL